MKKFLFISFLFTILFGNNLSKGLDLYRSRAEGSVGLKAKAEPINSEIE